MFIIVRSKRTFMSNCVVTSFTSFLYRYYMESHSMCYKRNAANRRCRPTYQYVAAPIYSYKDKIFMQLIQVAGGNAVLRHVVRSCFI